MGFFSWRCAKSGLSIASSYACLPDEYSDCYLVTPTNVYHESSYSGYGVFGGVDVYELLGDGDRDKGIFREDKPFDIKIVLAKYYNGEKYDELPPSDDCEYQGYFYDDEYLKSIGHSELCADEEEDKEVMFFDEWLKENHGQVWEGIYNDMLVDDKDTDEIYQRKQELLDEFYDWCEDSGYEGIE
jgi:hypothetical protein